MNQTAAFSAFSTTAASRRSMKRSLLRSNRAGYSAIGISSGSVLSSDMSRTISTMSATDTTPSRLQSPAIAVDVPLSDVVVVVVVLSPPETPDSVEVTVSPLTVTIGADVVVLVVVLSPPEMPDSVEVTVSPLTVTIGADVVVLVVEVSLVL